MGYIMFVVNFYQDMNIIANGEDCIWCSKAQEVVNPALVMNTSQNWKKEKEKKEKRLTPRKGWPYDCWVRALIKRKKKKKKDRKLILALV